MRALTSHEYINIERGLKTVFLLSTTATKKDASKKSSNDSA